VKANLRLAGQFGLAAAITLGIALITGFCCQQMLSEPPHGENTRKLVSAAAIPMLLLLGLSGLLLLGGTAALVAVMLEKLWRRSADQHSAEPNAAVDDGSALRVNSDAPGPPPLS
jgi:hypothetical protein